MKKIISLVLAMALMLSVMPVLPAAAEETTAETTAAVETTAPTEAVTVPAEKPAAPAEETTAPTADATVPVEETTAPTEAATAPTEETTIPTEEATAPAEETAPTEGTEPESETMTVEADAETGMLADQSETAEKLGVGESRTLTLSNCESKAFSFTPKSSGGYVFYMPYGRYNEEIGFSENFSLSIYKDGTPVGEPASKLTQFGSYCMMEAGQEYILVASSLLDMDADTYAVTAAVTLDTYAEPESFALKKFGNVVPGAELSFQIDDLKPENAFLLFVDKESLDFISWTVSNPEMVSLSNSWNNGAGFHVSDYGTATVTATLFNGVSASCQIKVSAPEKIEPGQSKQITLSKGENASFTFTPKTTGKYVFHMPYGEYHSEEGYYEEFVLEIFKDGGTIGEHISNYNDSGVYCTMEEGVEYTLSAEHCWETNADVTAAVYFDVLQEATSFSLDEVGPIYPGSSIELHLWDLLPENAYVIDTTWTVSDPNVISISNSDNTFARCLVVGEGTATVTATAGNGVSASFEVDSSALEKWEELGSKSITLDGGKKKNFQFIPQENGKYVLTVLYNLDDAHGDEMPDFDVSIIKDGQYIGKYVYNNICHGVCCEMEKGAEYILVVNNAFDYSVSRTVSLEPYKDPESLTVHLYELNENIYYETTYLHVGGECMITASANPESTFVTDVTLESSDPSVMEIEKNEYGRYVCTIKKAGTVTVTASEPNGAVGVKEVTVKSGEVLPVLDGADSTVTASSPLAVRIDGEKEKLDEVWVDGEKVEPENYTVTKGSTIITFTPEYLKTLETGAHLLNVYFTDGWAATNFEITPSALGDLNGDGKITSLDAAMVYAAVNNKKVLTDAEFQAADVDGNGKIQAKDASMVYAHVNNRLEKFPAEK